MWILNICVFAFASEIGALIQPLLFVKAKLFFFKKKTF